MAKRAKATPPRLHEVPGFRVAAMHCGIKSGGKRDLGLIVSDTPATAAALFTQNRITAAPVQHCRAALASNRGRVRAILANAGNANCCTGDRGRRDAAAAAARVAGCVGCDPDAVLLASTGIIGEPLPIDRVLAGVDTLAGRLDSKRAADRQFADAIRTLDTHAKEAGTTVRIGGQRVTLAGAAKGIGMCAPNMATVLVFLLTDAKVRAAALRSILKTVADETLNRVTVDGDTSTNDSCFLLANGAAGNRTVTAAGSADGRRLRDALRDVCAPLARMLAADGEGATKYLHVAVTGAASRADAERVARAVAESPLVKTAVCGADPNWGRVLMAAGKCGADVREADATVSICGKAVFRRGAPTRARPDAVAKAMRGREVRIAVDLGRGPDAAEMHGCDLTHGYITINADYHT